MINLSKTKNDLQTEKSKTNCENRHIELLYNKENKKSTEMLKKMYNNTTTQKQFLRNRGLIL